MKISNLKIAIEEVTDLKVSGSNFIGLCPFHDEKTPSFTYSPSKDIFHCFGCNTSGVMKDFRFKIEERCFEDPVYAKKLFNFYYEKHKDDDNEN